MFLVVIALAFLAAKLATKNDLDEDLEGILEADDDEYNEHFDGIDNERAIFIIDESHKIDTPDIVNSEFLSETIEQSEETDKNAPKAKNKQTKSGRIMSTLKQLRYSKGWLDIS